MLSLFVCSDFQNFVHIWNLFKINSKNVRVSNLVRIFKKCSQFEIMFALPNFVQSYKKCSLSQNLFPDPKICSLSSNFVPSFKKCSLFLFSSKFYEMFLFFKICSTLQKGFAVFQKFVHRSKNVQHFKIIIRYFWNCPRSKKDTGFENELRFSCKKRMNCVRTSKKV